MGESLGLDSWEHLKLNIHNINSFLIQTNIDSTFKLTKSKWILLCLIWLSGGFKVLLYLMASEYINFSLSNKT